MKTQACTKAAGLVTMTVALLLSVSAHGQQQIDETRKAQPDGVVEIENMFGSIVVRGWDRDEIQVTGTLGEEAEGLQFETRGRRTHIEVENDFRFGGRGRGSELEIRVPSGSRVAAEGLNTEIAVFGVEGAVELESVNGDIELEGNAAEVTIQAVNGRVTVTGVTSELNVDAVGGRVRLQDVGGHIAVGNVSGDIEIEAGRIERLEVSSVSGDIEVDASPAPDARIDLASHSGSVRLSLPEDVSAEFEIETFSGDVRNDLGPEARRADRYGPGKELRFVVGDGSVRIRVGTFSGSVELRKR